MCECVCVVSLVSELTAELHFSSSGIPGLKKYSGFVNK